MIKYDKGDFMNKACFMLDNMIIYTGVAVIDPSLYKTGQTVRIDNQPAYYITEIAHEVNSKTGETFTTIYVEPVE